MPESITEGSTVSGTEITESDAEQSNDNENETETATGTGTGTETGTEDASDEWDDHDQ